MTDNLNSQELDAYLTAKLFTDSESAKTLAKDMVRREQEAARKVITRATEMIEREIHHAKDNGQYLINVQGLGPGERILAVRIDYLKAVLRALNQSEEQK